MTTHIKNLLQEFFKGKESENKTRDRISNITKLVLGDNLTKSVFVGKIEKDKLYFSSRSSNCSFEFDLRKNLLLKEIQKEFPFIKELKIKLG